MQFLQFLRDHDSIHAAKKLRKEAIVPLAHLEEGGIGVGRRIDDYDRLL